MPLRKVLQKEYKKRFKPWITDRVLSKINEKNQALKDLIINNNNPITKEQLNWNFKTLKNEVTNRTKQSKKDYYNQYFTDNTKNLQKIWKGIKEVINIKAKNYTTLPAL